MDWHCLEVQDVLRNLQGSQEGLSSLEVRQRREKYGKNEIQSGKKVWWGKIFISQFTNFLVVLLVIAALISFFIGSVVDASLIMLIVFLNGIFGFIQNYRAEKSIEALKKLSVPKAKVIRDGERQTIESTDLVPGDVIFVEQGDSVPADALILECDDPAVDESLLTGESLPVEKKKGVLETSTPLAEKTNMLFKSTNITRGRVRAIVVETGMNTEVGRIAAEIQTAKEKKTPFQSEINTLGRKIGIGVLTIVGVVVVIELLAGRTSPVETFLVAISLAVAAVPEGLPAVLTLSLAVGSRKMLRRKALVRRLPVVESLGSVDVICTDKTGTLTENMMTVQNIYFEGKVYSVSGEGSEEKGTFEADGKSADPKDLEMVLKCGVLCNNAQKGKTGYLGDPTEVALLVVGEKAGLDKVELEKDYLRVSEVSFTSERKRMATIHTHRNTRIMFVKGAPEVILERCDKILGNGKIRELTQEKKDEISKKTNQFAENALRVLAFAYKVSDTKEENMVFVGLQAMIDPPRKEVKGALKDCMEAGIRVIMITGDNATTAKAIGDKIGLKIENIVTGKELDKLSESELNNTIETTSIFARVSPFHKTRLLKALQSQGHIVAMTGDGINDAPALKNSDVGVAMGQKGTDVARQASEMVLLDDNFRTIRDAIEEGRGIFDNIRKFVNYLLSANTAEVLVVFLASVFGLGLPLTAVMILWINLLTDGLPALALSVDAKSKFIMKRKPRKKGEGVIDKRTVYSIITMGTAMAIIILVMFRLSLSNMARAQSIVFTSLVVFELVRVQAVRSRYGIAFFTNKWLSMAILSTVVLQIMLLYSPLNTLFGLIPLGIDAWLMIFAGLVIFALSAWALRKVEDRFFGSLR